MSLKRERRQFTADFSYSVLVRCLNHLASLCCHWCSLKLLLRPYSFWAADFSFMFVPYEKTQNPENILKLFMQALKNIYWESFLANCSQIPDHPSQTLWAVENPPNWSLYVHNFLSMNKLILEPKHPGRPISIWHPVKWS